MGLKKLRTNNTLYIHIKISPVRDLLKACIMKHIMKVDKPNNNKLHLLNVFKILYF